ncbi:MAG: sulfate adenylyltransferase [Firmicutes bacterium]|nr:sulfate adenylyltransferase [Bacillota bacterium]
MRPASLNPPHGGMLAEQELPLELASELAGALPQVPVITLDRFHYDEVICLATGVYSPLRGFQNRDDVQSVIDDMRLASGQLWPIPITLAVSADEFSQLKKARLARLAFDGEIVALMHLEDLFWQDPETEAQAIYGTRDTRHPGVRRVLATSPLRAAGPVTLTTFPRFPVSPVLTPRQMRQLISRRGWTTVVGFQTRNPLHRAHEYIQKVALEFIDGLVLHPLIGTTKADDVPVDVRWRVYETLLQEYYPKERVWLSGFPAPMRYAGPREAVLHALARKNYGFTHFIVGRDHAGVGDFYPPTASQQLCRELQDRLGIEILTPEPAFYCHKCGQLATTRTCPHGADLRHTLSGTAVRQALKTGGALPDTVIRAEVADILHGYYHSRAT